MNFVVVFKGDGGIQYLWVQIAILCTFSAKYSNLSSSSWKAKMCQICNRWSYGAT